MDDAPDLRGDYSEARADYTIEQDWKAYTDNEHALWRLLYHRQMASLPRYACPEVVEAVRAMDMADGIPNLARVSDWLSGVTGWRLIAVPGLVPDDVFFAHLAERRFPVTIWIRKPEELDYLVEPDVFHDFFGHVPVLANPAFADYMQAYGRKGPEAIKHGAVKSLARFYWYTAEFGLIRTAAGIRVFGAGILSSHGELAYALDAAEPNRIGFRLERVMQTDYRIDSYQKSYFVLDSFDQLFAATHADFAPLYDRVAGRELIPAEAVLPDDVVFHRGTAAAPLAA
jgi:phenylalanine-4-hydroxylase